MNSDHGPFTATQVMKEEASAIQAGREHRLALGLIGEEDVTARDHVGLAISGGGIRSATFALGGLQTLAKRGLLARMDYLSTVSGGGYIGSWLTAWILREGFDVVNDDLASDTSRLPPDDQDPHFLEPRPIHYLRKYTSYLTPKVGLVSGDTWAAIAIYLRNLLLNQAILIGCLMLLLLLPRLLAKGLTMVVGSGTVTSGEWIIFCVAWVWASCFAGLGLNAFRHTGRRSHFSRQRKLFLKPAWFAAPVVISAFAGAFALYAERQCRSNLVSPWLDKIKHSTSFERPVIVLLAGVLGVLILTGLTSLFAAIGEKRIYGGQGSADVSPVRPSVLRWVLAPAATGAAVVGMLYLYWTYVPPPSDVSALLITTFGPPMLLLVFVLAGWLQIGVMGTAFPDAKREWLARGAGLVMVFAAGWAVFSAIALYSPVLFGMLVTKLQGASWSWLIPPAWITTVISGLKAAQSSKTGGKHSNPWLEVLAKLAPPVFLVGLGMALAWLMQCMISGPPHSLGDIANAIWKWDAATIRMVLAAAIASSLIFFVDVNEFSMHLFYRNRLVRAYLGASNIGRNPHPFTGFAADDDVRLSDLDPNRVENASTKAYAGPYPLVCTALNLVGGDDLAWQQRKATSFVYSPKFCGYDHLQKNTNPALYEQGYRPTADFSGSLGPHLGTAMAASGAAASPNMGYHSSPAVAALMTFFDVRLGWWVGNPRNPDTWKKYGPAPYYLFNELLSKTNDESNYLYLSDGGHFENLAVYELVRRRLKLIIALDGDADSDYGFSDLGNLIEKCRRDLGADIDISVQGISPIGDPLFSKSHYAIGKITYRALTEQLPEDHGWLIYVKSSLCGEESEDVLAYRRAHQVFPHDPTADQFFTESQFESYRALGEHAVDCALTRLFGTRAMLSVDQMVGVVRHLHGLTL